MIASIAESNHGGYINLIAAFESFVMNVWLNINLVDYKIQEADYVNITILQNLL